MISQTAEYALRAIVALGSSPDRPVTTRQVAARTRVPAGYLSKVLQALGKGGLVEAQRGLHGGFILARPLDDLTVLDVIQAVDPRKRIGGCVPGRMTHRQRMCQLHRRLDEGIALVEGFFGDTTIAQLIAAQAPGQPLCESAAIDSCPTCE